MLKKSLIIIVSLSILTGLSYAQRIVVSDSGKQEFKTSFRGHKCTGTKREIYVKNYGPVKYGFRYNYHFRPSGKEGLPDFPYIGDATARTTGLGLTMGGAWYKEGFLGIRMNGKALGRTVASEINVEQGERGVVDVLWEPEWAEIKARFVFLPKDDKIYTEITLAPKVEVKSLNLFLVCFPGHWTEYSKKPYDRWISTAKRSIQLTGKEEFRLTPDEEPWIFYFDTQENTTKGTCAVMYLPEEVKGARMLKSTDHRTYLTVSPEVRKIHLIFWDFPDSYKKPEEAYNYLKENGKELMENLRKFKFEL